jgi:hypothetical protein
MSALLTVGIALLAMSGAARAQTSEQLIDAMVFVAKGEEDGMPVEKSAPIKKTFKNGRYEYASGGFEGALVTHATSSKPCVFEMGITIFGDQEVASEVFNLNKATKFELKRITNDSIGHFGDVVLEGGDSYCVNGECTYYHSMSVKNVDDKPRQKQLEVLARYEKAIEFLKKKCVGRPY